MRKRFSDRALIISSLILGVSIIIAALIITPKNPLAPIVAPAWKATFESESVKRQFLKQLAARIRNYPDEDAKPGSQLQSITVESVTSGTHMIDVRGLKIEYTITYSPTGTYKYVCWLNRVSSGRYYGFAPYGRLYSREIDPSGRVVDTHSRQFARVEVK